jgi:hypothetical protein
MRQLGMIPLRDSVVGALVFLMRTPPQRQVTSVYCFHHEVFDEKIVPNRRYRESLDVVGMDELELEHGTRISSATNLP